MSRFILLIFIFILFSNSLHASTWTGQVGDNKWDTAGNWDPAGAPNGETAQAVIPIDAAIELDTSISLADLNVSNAVTVTLTGTGANTLTFFSSDPNPNIVAGNLSNTNLALAANASFDLLAELDNIANVTLSTLTTPADTSLTLSYSNYPRLSFANITLNTATLGSALNVNSDVLLSLTGTNQMGGLTLLGERAMLAAQQNSSNTFVSPVSNSGTMLFIHNSTNIFQGTISNDTAASMHFTGTAGSQGSTNTFADVITNSGSIYFYGTDDGGNGHSTNNFNGSFENQDTAQAVFYENSVNTFTKAVTADSYSSIVFKDDSINAFNLTVDLTEYSSTFFLDNSENTFSNVVTIQGYSSLQFLGSAQNTFEALATVNQMDSAAAIFSDDTVNDFSAAITLSGVGAIQFIGNSANTFNAGATIVSLGQGAIVFSGNSINDFSDAISNSLDGAIFFRGSSTNTFNAGATITNQSGSLDYSDGAIYFSGESVNTFGDAISNPASGAYYFNNGNDAQTSINTFNSTISNSATGVMFFQGQSVNDFNDTVTSAGTLNFLEDSISTFNSTLLGAGNINISGDAQVSFTAAGNTFTGNTSVSQNATLTVSGEVSASTIVVGNANNNLKGGTLATTGAGSSLFNVSLLSSGFGTFVPAVSETTTLTGGYTQAGGTLHIRILNSVTPTNLDITGAATLGGTLYLELLNGYTAGNYVIMDADGGITGDFATITTSNRRVRGTGGVVGNTYVVSVPATVQLPQKIKKLKPQNRSLAKQIVSSAKSMIKNQDAQKVVNALARQSPVKFESDLNQLKPANRIQLDSNRQFSKLRHISHLKNCFKSFKNLKAFVANNNFSKTRSIFEPRIKSIYFCNNLCANASKRIDTRPSIEEKNAAFGWMSLLGDALALTQSFSCFETENKVTNREAFNGMTFSYAPTLGWIGERFYINSIFMANFNQNNQKRYVQFAGIKREASSSYHSLESSAEINAGYTLALPKAVHLDLEGGYVLLGKFCQPYQEKGAGCLNLFVKQDPVYQSNSSLKLTAKKEFFVSNLSLSANVFAEASSTMSLNKSMVHARLDFAPQNSFFTVMNNGNYKSRFLGGAKIAVKSLIAFELSTEAVYKRSKNKNDLDLKGNFSLKF